MRKIHALNLVGQTYGFWKVVSLSHTNQRGEKYWNCICRCGVKRSVKAGSLRSGKSLSCGCHHITAVTDHGMTGTRTFKSWGSMRQRCNNPNDPSYNRYGGAGIKVCKRWNESFSAFLEDMGERPDGTTLDRIDGSKGYTPSNCRWSDTKQQLNNRRTTRRITAFGKCQTISDWHRKTGLTISAISDRLGKGMSPEEALSTPSRKRNCRRKRLKEKST